MQVRRKSSGLVTARAISGTHVVFLAFGMNESDAKGLMGFAIQRTDLTDDETIWLRGNKTFASIRPSTGIEDASSHKHPFQAFQWADYSAKPGYRYRYRVIPMYGKAGALTQRAATRIAIATEPLSGERHDVHFNRLRAAIYELKWPQVLAAFKDAARAGADVKILYHAKAADTGTENDQQIDDAHIRSLCVPRKNAKLMHNKFIVISKAGKPIAVWTGCDSACWTSMSTAAPRNRARRRSPISNAFVGTPTSGWRSGNVFSWIGSMGGIWNRTPSA